MTENQWPQTLPPASPNGYPPAGDGNGGVAGSQSKKDAAKSEAADVTGHAAAEARSVAETAKSEAANVASEAAGSARDLLLQARTDLTEQAGAQQQKAAEGIRALSSQLQSMADASDQPGVATDLVRQAAERSSAVAGWLDGRDPGSLLTEVTTFARKRPGTFLLLAAGAGVLAGRLSRSLSAGAPESGVTAAAKPADTRIPDTGVAVPPPPVQMPAPETSTAGFADTYSTGAAASGPLGEGGRQDRWGSEPVVTDPPRQDPFRDDPFDGGRR